jgi:hypothetical protein
MRKGELETRNIELERDNAALSAQVEALEQQLADARLVGTVASGAQLEIERLQDEGVVGSEALEQATANVVDRERSRLVRSERERLEEEVSDGIIEQLRTEQLPTIRERLMEGFREDGTMARLTREARQQVEEELRPGVLQELVTAAEEEFADPVKREEVRDALRQDLEASDEIARLREDRRFDIEAEERDKVRRHLEDEVVADVDTDESRAAIAAGVREELLDSDELRAFREGLLRQRRSDLREPVADELRADIARQVAGEEPSIRARIRRELEESDDIAEYRRTTTVRLEREVSAMTDEEVREAVNDQELERLLRDRADAMKEELRREKVARELNEAFTRGDGIDVMAIEKGTAVEIYLGETEDIGPYTFVEPNPNGTDDQKVEKQTTFYARKLTLACVGNGKFVVNGDSFFSANVGRHERNAGILSGTIIAIGRQEKNGQESSLAPALFADVPLWYDVDTTDDKIKSALYPVLDVVISGVSARGVEHVDLRTVDTAGKKA